jgi:hypothetical protein
MIEHPTKSALKKFSSHGCSVSMEIRHPIKNLKKLDVQSTLNVVRFLLDF